MLSNVSVITHNRVSLLLWKGAKNYHEKNLSYFTSWTSKMASLSMINQKNKLWILYKSTFTFLFLFIFTLKGFNKTTGLFFYTSLILTALVIVNLPQAGTMCIFFHTEIIHFQSHLLFLSWICIPFWNLDIATFFSWSHECYFQKRYLGLSGFWFLLCGVLEFLFNV